jgi:hypothetical protein
MPREISRPLAGAVVLAFSAAIASIPAAPATAQTTVTVTPDPSYRHQTFEGWGTSLVWMSNATGGYPDEIRNQLVDMVFGEQGLNLNIARYNIAGENAPNIDSSYMKDGADMDGFWAAPPGTTH